MSTQRLPQSSSSASIETASGPVLPHRIFQSQAAIAEGYEIFARAIVAAQQTEIGAHCLLILDLPDGHGAIDYVRICNCGWVGIHTSRELALLNDCPVHRAQAERLRRALHDGERVIARLRDVALATRLPIVQPIVPPGGAPRHE